MDVECEACGTRVTVRASQLGAAVLIVHCPTCDTDRQCIIRRAA